MLSDRRAHCENLKLSLRKINVDAALYLGGMKNYELKKSEEARVLLGTYALAREGLDIPSLDALVLRDAEVRRHAGVRKDPPTDAQTCPR